MRYTKAYMQSLIGKKVSWVDNYDPDRGVGITRSGVCTDAQGKNIWIDDDPKWLPDLRFFKVEGEV